MSFAKLLGYIYIRGQWSYQYNLCTYIVSEISTFSFMDQLNKKIQEKLVSNKYWWSLREYVWRINQFNSYIMYKAFYINLTGSSLQLSSCNQHSLPRHQSFSWRTQILWTCVLCPQLSSPTLWARQQKLWVALPSVYPAEIPVNHKHIWHHQMLTKYES